MGVLLSKMHLPPIDQMINRCRALATLDLIFSPEWQFRYHSFNAHWSGDEMMASMRNGCGDEWWAVFHRDGWAALKGLDHESPAWDRHRETLSSALQRTFPSELEEFSNEAAFRWNETSFAYFHVVGAADWTCANDLSGYAADAAGDSQLLAHVVGSPADYAVFAADYYETEAEEQIIAEIFALRPITEAIVANLNPAISLEDIAGELYGEIQYPRARAA